MTVHHVALETRPDDADAVVAFFVLLGFAEVPPPATLSERARWVERGATQVHVLYADDPVVPPSGHVAIVKDADGDYEILSCRSATEYGGNPPLLRIGLRKRVAAPVEEPAPWPPPWPSGR